MLVIAAQTIYIHARLMNSAHVIRTVLEFQAVHNATWKGPSHRRTWCETMSLWCKLRQYLNNRQSLHSLQLRRNSSCVQREETVQVSEGSVLTSVCFLMLHTASVLLQAVTQNVTSTCTQDLAQHRISHSFWFPTQRMSYPQTWFNVPICPEAGNCNEHRKVGTTSKYGAPKPRRP